MKEKIIKTKRLIISPLSYSELESKINAENDEHLKTVYADMLRRCAENEYDRYWNTLWVIYEKSSMNEVGSISFLGAPYAYEAKIGYGINEEYRSKGYAKEAIKKFCDYTFEKDENLYFISADCEKGNAASQSVLLNNKFTEESTNEKELLHFALARPVTYWTAIFLIIGASMGVAIGMTDNKFLLTLLICMFIGFLAGFLIDNKEKKKVKIITSKRKLRLNSTIGRDVIKDVENDNTINQDMN